jgi:hypothetical protein
VPRWGKWLVGVAGGAATAFGALTGALSILPRLTIVPENMETPLRYPLSEPFVVKNEGMIPVWDVNWYCELFRVGGLLGGRRGYLGGIIIPGGESFRSIEPGDAISIPCTKGGLPMTPLLPDSTTGAIITLGLTFRPWLLPNWNIFVRSREATFAGFRDNLGVFHWSANPFPSSIRDSMTPINWTVDTSTWVP